MVIPDQHKVIKKPVIYKVYPERYNLRLFKTTMIIFLLNYFLILTQLPFPIPPPIDNLGLVVHTSKLLLF